MEDAVARQDTLTQLIAQIRRVGREIPGAGVTVAGLTGHDYTQPGKPDIAWDDRDARDELVSRLVTDALALLGSIHGRLNGEATGDRGAVGVGCRAGRGTGGGLRRDRWSVAHRPPGRCGSVISTVDPDARHTHKSREKKVDGYKSHVIAEPDTGLVTAAILTKHLVRRTVMRPGAAS